MFVTGIFPWLIPGIWQNCYLIQMICRKLDWLNESRTWGCLTSRRSVDTCRSGAGEAVRVLVSMFVRPVMDQSSTPGLATPSRYRRSVETYSPRHGSSSNNLKTRCSLIESVYTLHDKVKTIWLRAWQRLFVVLPVAGPAVLKLGCCVTGKRTIRTVQTNIWKEDMCSFQSR